MGFWIFMLIADLLIPTTMMVFGKRRLTPSILFLDTELLCL